MVKQTKDKRQKGVACLVPDDNQDDRVELPNWDEWHVPARDTQGHYSNMRLKVPRQLEAEAQKAVKSECYPYRSVGYLFRHALLKHLFWLQDHPEYRNGVGSTINAVNAMVRLIREDEYLEDFRLVFERLDNRVRDYENRGNRGRAKQLVIQIWAEIKKMEDDFWRGEYERELKRRFGNLLEVKKPETVDEDDQT